jgi:hypothetical protein
MILYSLTMEISSSIVLLFVSLFLLLLPLFHLIIIFLIVDIVDYFGS